MHYKSYSLKKKMADMGKQLPQKQTKNQGSYLADIGKLSARLNIGQNIGKVQETIALTEWV